MEENAERSSKSALTQVAAFITAIARLRKRFTGEEKTAGVVGDGERITVLAIAQQELAFVIRTPELIGALSQR